MQHNIIIFPIFNLDILIISRAVWKAILLGQYLSLLNCSSGVISQYLSTYYYIDAPTAQSFLNYVLLCMVYTTWLACKPGEHGLILVLRSRGWKYFLLAIVDVEANYLVVKAYQYTTLTSIQLLDCFTIPTVLALSWIILKVRYKIVHILGVGVCLLGVGCVVWADAEEDNDEGVSSNDRLVGDMLCLAGAALYGISNVGQEFTVKNYATVEFLGMIGLFGSVINGIQLAILERQSVATIKWDVWQIDVLIISFALVMFLFYSTVPLVMKMTSATAFNLSILSCDFYSLVVGVFLFKFQFQLLYLLSFTLVIIGVIMYSLQPTDSINRPTNYRDVTNDAMENNQGDLSLGTSISPSNSVSSSYRGYPQSGAIHPAREMDFYTAKSNENNY